MFYKLMFINWMMLGSIISISANTWIGVWMGLEINLLSIIPLINKTNNSMSSESSMKYFISQAMASTIILVSIMMMMMKLNYNLMLTSAILMKMGSAPFHFWFPEVMEGLNWNNSLIMLTWQKLTPMVLLMYTLNSMMFMNIIILMNLLIGGIQGLNQISLRKILAYSSINHIAWMIPSINLVSVIWVYYFIIYAIISINICLMFNFMNTYYISQMILTNFSNPLKKFIIMMNFFNLGGLPPFLGFLPKWVTIQMMVNFNYLVISMMMIILTLITLYYYMRILYSTLMMNSAFMKFKFSMKNYMFTFMNIISLMALILSTLMFNLF
uniref:NADH-ubiquinone oxidoreductase chain 2 n=1 Tax=Staphylinoidea sp. 14 KM-2017 TaxID=2219454 RepID=A0A346RJ24_9COLE|nr:NADH dehydrogenase subunit 2 [Staphylinoidea sp. 14 KM-2017]